VHDKKDKATSRGLKKDAAVKFEIDVEEFENAHLRYKVQNLFNSNGLVPIVSNYSIRR